MSTQTVSAADAILKDDYIGPVIEQINQKTYVLDQIQRDVTSVDHTGRRAIVPVHSSRNRGRGSRADAGTLPTAGVQAWQDAIVPIRYHYIAIEISDGIMEASTSNQGAFLNVLTAETKGAAQDAKKDVNRQVYGTGDGLLGTVTVTATTSTVITLDSVQYTGVGDPVDVLVKSSGATSTGAVATSIVAKVGDATKTVTLATTVNVDLTFGVYIAGNRNQEMDGLRNIASTGRTLHSINSATAGNEFWNGQVRSVGTSSTAAVAGETSFEQLADDVSSTGQGDITTFLTSRGIRRRLADTYQSQKRFNDAQAVRVRGGYSAIMVNEIPVIADDDCPRGFAFGIDNDALRWFTQVEFAWMEKSGGGVFHLKDGSTAGTKTAVWQAFGKRYSALGSVRPNSIGKLQYCEDDNPGSGSF
jgi:hypothetical protein